MHRVSRKQRVIISAVLVVLLAATVPLMALADAILVPGTAVLLSQSSSGGGGGGGGTSSATNIFSPASYVDYKRFGGEPTITIDRYPFTTGTYNGQSCTASNPCYRDIAYASSPNGFAYPHYSPFWKSDDLGQSFRVPCHTTAQGQTCGTGGGGGDSHQAIGQVTHRLFFVDLPGPGCVTNNVSDDLGETFVGDNAGCGQSPGAIDDRQWVEADELFPTSPNVYISFINFTNIAAPTLSLARSQHDGNPGTFVTDSVCNTLNSQIPSGPIINPLPIGGAGDSQPTVCPDPADVSLQIAGPVVADKEGTATRPPTHNLYIPFVRGTAVIPGLTSGPPYSLWVAKSTDGGATWTRNQVAFLGDHNPVNLFPQLVVDRGGNLYYTWSQTQGPGQNESGLLGETDVYYTFSTNGGVAWAPPIDLTQSAHNTAVMPWLVAGDPGMLDIVYYQSNTGLNPNIAEVDANGNACDANDPEATCTNSRPNPSIWNVIFGQNNHALNTGSNFNNVQITDHPNHIGQICTAGTACSGDRDLLDFFTIDVDHLGAANVIWADDNTTTTSDTRNKFSRQLSGSSVYRSTNISLMNSWPIRDHSVTDRAGDTFNNAGIANGSCPGMDLLGASVNRSGDQLSVSLTLNGPPTSANAVACSTAGVAPGAVPASGGLWSVEFWAAASDNPNTSATETAENFYIGYRDNPLDGAPRVEGGRFDKTNAVLTSLEFDPTSVGTLDVANSTCLAVGPPTPCTIAMTLSATTLGVKPGAGLFSITGLSAYVFGRSGTPVVRTRFEPGNSEQSDAAAPFDYNGTGTTGR